MKRVLSIWLPGLAIERWKETADCPHDAPVVLTVEGTHGPIIHAVTRAAAERGTCPGARLTDARALDPGLVAVPADPDGDAAFLKQIAIWAGRWSPLVERDGADGLRLDVTGVDSAEGVLLPSVAGGDCNGGGEIVIFDQWNKLSLVARPRHSEADVRKVSATSLI